MENNAIVVNNLCVSYRVNKGFSIQKCFTKKNKDTLDKEFQAVKNISFKTKKGEILGIIGKNGSGKSTMLRALAGIFSPNSGFIDLKGNSISLLSIGVGFKPEMTGRDNVILSGMLLGFSKREIDERMQSIIEFAEIGTFIDQPVRTYSSGMYSKLAFSITVSLETDIILIDEVLSVGDEKFRRKSYERMKTMIQDKQKTVVIVSHSIPMLNELCDTVMWMHGGEIMQMGEADIVLKNYNEFMAG